MEGVRNSVELGGLTAPRRAAPRPRAVAPALPATARAATFRSVHPVVRYAFYGFVFSIPFEYPDRPIPLEVHTVTCALFLLVTLLQPRACYARVPKAVGWFAVYVAVFAVRGAFTPHAAEVLHLLFNLALILGMFVAAYNLMRYAPIAEAALLTFVASATALGLIQVTGISRTVVEAASSVGARYSVFGQDPNTLAGNMVLGLVILAGLAYGRSARTLRPAPLVWAAAAVMAGSLVLTGTRGALIALVAGLMAFALKAGSPLTWLKHMLLALAALGLFCAACYSIGPMRARFESTWSEGKLAGREEIFPRAWDMFLERPLAGWGPIGNLYELADRTRDIEMGKRVENLQRRDTHNVALEVLTGTGLLGAVPFFVCGLASLRAGWRARGGTQAILPFSLAATVLLLGLSINMTAFKQIYLFLAYALAAGICTPRRPAARRR